MRTAALFTTSSQNQAVCIPREYEFRGVSEVEIYKEGDSLILRPVRPRWSSLLNKPTIEEEFLKERQPVIDESRFIKGFE